MKKFILAAIVLMFITNRVPAMAFDPSGGAAQRSADRAYSSYNSRNTSNSQSVFQVSVSSYKQNVYSTNAGRTIISTSNCYQNVNQDSASINTNTMIITFSNGDSCRVSHVGNY
jgi:hypothetical protein